MIKTKLVVLAVLLFFLHNIYKTYRAHDPPVAGKDSTRVVKAWVPDDAFVKVWLFVSELAEHPVGLPPMINLYPRVMTKTRPREHLVGTMELPTGAASARTVAVPPEPRPWWMQWLPRRQPAVSISTVVKIPDELKANRTLFFYAVTSQAASTDVCMMVASSKLTKYISGAQDKRPTRLLLKESASNAPGRRSEPSASVPRAITLGPVQEHRPFDLKRALDSGLRMFIIPRKKIQYAPVTVTADAPKQDDSMFYMFPMHLNSMVSPRDEYQPLIPKDGNENASIEIEVTYSAPSYRYWRMQHEFDAALQMMEEKWGFGAYDVDSLRMMTGSVGLVALLFTYLISILHLLLEILALSSDITFWRKQEETQLSSLSANTYFLEAVFTAVVFAYLYETRESRFVLWFCGARFAMDIWKILKLRKARAARRKTNTENGAVDEIEAFEHRCMKILGVVLIPIVVAVSAHQLVNVPQRGWASWVVNSLAICAYTGGFVTMTPQLFRNYKLKSVDHMPWATLSYQAVNTFIDDIFSFIIRMPELHRMSVFRDDIVFVIYMYQVPCPNDV
eukprot:Polyplicarium_translucidae@DN1124_c0_g1_i1.p1